MNGLAAAPKDMGDIIRLYAQIALLRRGPQDVPASALLCALTVLAYVLVNAAAGAVLPSDDHVWGPLLADVLFTAAWYVVLLRVSGRPERTLQLLSALFGIETLLSPPQVAAEWLMRRFGEGSVGQLAATALGLLLLAWLIAASTHVVKAALEWSGAASAALVILEILAGWMAVAARFPPVKG